MIYLLTGKRGYHLYNGYMDEKPWWSSKWRYLLVDMCVYKCVNILLSTVCVSGKFENFNKNHFLSLQPNRMAGWKIAYITALTYNPIDFPFFYVSFTLFSRNIIGIFFGSGNIDIIKGFPYIYSHSICQFIIIIQNGWIHFRITKNWSINNFMRLGCNIWGNVL